MGAKKKTPKKKLVKKPKDQPESMELPAPNPQLAAAVTMVSRQIESIDPTRARDFILTFLGTLSCPCTTVCLPNEVITLIGVFTDLITDRSPPGTSPRTYTIVDSAAQAFAQLAGNAKHPDNEDKAAEVAELVMETIEKAVEAWNHHLKKCPGPIPAL